VRVALSLIAALVAAVALAGPAQAATAGAATTATTATSGTTTSTIKGPTTPLRGPSDPNAISRPETLTGFPLDHRLNGKQALEIAGRVKKIREELRKYPTAKPEVFLKGQTRWKVSWFTPGTGEARKEVAQVIIDDATGVVTEAWTGPQVAWTMARGYPGAFGRKVNAPWVWIPLTILFVAPFLSWRRGLRLLQVDLMVLVAFGASVAFFNDANLDVSVPLVVPLLAYLLARMAWIGLRRPREDEPPPGPLPLRVPVVWLAVGLVFLIGFRIGLNITSSNVIDVGYSGVIGADRIADGEKLYGHFPNDNRHGDTYGPVAYLAYMPFEQLLPWSGRWDDLPAAHAAAITFDLLTILLLFLVGRRLRGTSMGIVLAYAWAAWPFSLYTLACNSNDALVAALGALTLLVAGRPALRGAAAALAGFSKLGSLGLVPLLATHGARAGDRLRTVAWFALGFAVVTAIAWLPIVVHGESLSTIWDRTLGFQATRDAPFSIWGLYDWPAPQRLWQGMAVAFGIAVAFIPRRRDLVGLAALAAAVLIALQLGLTYWFYLYLVWFFPFVAVALFGRWQAPLPARSSARLR